MRERATNPTYRGVSALETRYPPTNGMGGERREERGESGRRLTLRQGIAIERGQSLSTTVGAVAPVRVFGRRTKLVGSPGWRWLPTQFVVDLGGKDTWGRVSAGSRSGGPSLPTSTDHIGILDHPQSPDFLPGTVMLGWEALWVEPISTVCLEPRDLACECVRERGERGLEDAGPCWNTKVEIRMHSSLART